MWWGKEQLKKSVSREDYLRLETINCTLALQDIYMTSEF
jgi:hypothetical protein